MTTPAKQSSTVFPQSKIKEIALTDPDVKDIPKKGIETLKSAAEFFATYLFSKCFEEAHRNKRITANLSDFVSAVKKDDALNAMLGQFLVNERDIPKENDQDDIEDIGGDSDNENDDNDSNEESFHDKKDISSQNEGQEEEENDEEKLNKIVDENDKSDEEDEKELSD
ncbi:hypothetical protein TRFO_40366 [Tritrichomonas foetus]|uniref:Transcription factor CBF/NF-Y/archaeal histone domain-containing protein n=1 Tax=Tritrichomonas foetus TaxID=1144522 RepID=A0A1J4J5E0_9EUKA|nr:hypothetical protein TRFO_40366 [Tritrichomonas foetus]|eukprot:OHS93351.1 hypothetical protein TRFO_40366 [Tritrichomonas foetus]